MARHITCLIAAIVAYEATARAEPTVLVRIDSDSEVVLQRQDSDGNWRGICVGACNQQVPTGTKLRVIGEMPPSAPFVLPGTSGQDVTLAVRGGSRAAVTGGAVMIGFGSAALTAAPFLALLGELDCFFKTSCFSGFSTAAIFEGLGGGVLLGIGIALVALNEITHVDGGGVVSTSPQLHAPVEDPVPKVTFPNETNGFALTLPVLYGTF